jgi:selenide,water dikinase
VIAVNVAAWPGDGLPLTLLAEVLRGAAGTARAAGCLVVGGHTIDDPVPKYGMAVVGMANPDALMTIDRAVPGDRLILTKPLGTGVVTTALKRDGADAESLGAAVDSMTALNASASEAALAAGVRAATDVTGFGLLGHLHRMLSASRVAAELDASRVPMLPGAMDLARRGFVSGGTRANIARMEQVVAIDASVPTEVAVLLHDAQTSGGLLLSVNPGSGDALLTSLTDRGLRVAEVGAVVAGPPGRITIR